MENSGGTRRVVLSRLRRRTQVHIARGPEAIRDLVGGRGSEAEIRGGLFQDFAPSVFHLTHVLLPMLAQMGMAAEVDLVRPGYVPAGGGVIRVAVPPTAGPPRPQAPRGTAGHERSASRADRFHELPSSLPGKVTSVP